MKQFRQAKVARLGGATLMAVAITGAADGATVTVSPQSAAYDQVVDIAVSGLPPLADVDVRMRSAAAAGGVWEADARFRSDPLGSIDLAHDAPTSGGYSGVDSMGLFWSLAWTGNAADQSQGYKLLSDLQVDVSVAGTAVASAVVHRQSCYATVMRKPVAEDGLVGTLFAPADGRRHPGLLVLGGSEGGIPEYQACMAAAHGFTALALGYFGLPTLPPELVKIPLEYFATGMAWLQRQAAVQQGRLGVMGGSKGAELSLLLAANYPDEIAAVVAYAASAYRWDGISQAPDPGCSWTKAGVELPCLRFDAAAVDFSHPPYALLNGYSEPLGSSPDPAARIPVERARAEIMLISGADDQMWPSPIFAHDIVDSLAASGYSHRVVSLEYPSAGHGIMMPYLPTSPTFGAYNLGGTAAGDAAASRDSWPEALRFLGEGLRQD